MVGYGMWKVPKEATADMVVTAIKAGYRLFDNACDYGNEKEVGMGLKKAFDMGLVKREDIWVTSKLWNTYHAKEHVRTAFEKSLSDLGLEYLDLYLIHFPVAIKFVPFEKNYPPGWIHDPNSPNPRMELADVPLRETWEAMEELVDAGLVRNIGLSNFNTSLIRDLLTYARIKPVMNQVELHPYLAQEKLIKFCHLNNIHVTAYSTFGGTSYIEMGWGNDFEVLQEKVIKDIAKTYKKSPAQIALKWAVQRGTSIIPKTSNPERLQENLHLFDFKLSEEEMKAITSLDRNQHFNDPGVYCEPMFKCFCPIFE